jgi:hypothetical protein
MERVIEIKIEMEDRIWDAVEKCADHNNVTAHDLLTGYLDQLIEMAVNEFGDDIDETLSDEELRELNHDYFDDRIADWDDDDIILQ